MLYKHSQYTLHTYHHNRNYSYNNRNNILNNNNNNKILNRNNNNKILNKNNLNNKQILDKDQDQKKKVN